MEIGYQHSSRILDIAGGTGIQLKYPKEAIRCWGFSRLDQSTTEDFVRCGASQKNSFWRKIS